MIMRQNIPNRCLAVSELIYSLFHIIEFWSDYKINILLIVGEESTIGHAWVTRNGRKFLSPEHKISRKIVEVGRNGKYVYYVNEKIDMMETKNN